jgi:hypothetical protein
MPVQVESEIAYSISKHLHHSLTVPQNAGLRAGIVICWGMTRLTNEEAPDLGE